MADPMDELINDITGIERQHRDIRVDRFICKSKSIGNPRGLGRDWTYTLEQEGWVGPAPSLIFQSAEELEVGKMYELFLRPEVKS